CPHISSDHTSCPYDYELNVPFAIVATSGGDVRFLYTRRRLMGTATYGCFGELGCYFDQGFCTGDLELWIAWPNGHGTFGTTLLTSHLYFRNERGTDSIFPASANAGIDASGRIHFVAEEADNSVVYYVIGAASGSRR